MKKHIIFLSLITLFVLACTTIASAYPKATDHAKRWQFDFHAGDLAFYRDEESGDGYWVMRYEVTNNTGNDRQWTPNMELVTDKGEIIVDGKDVPRDVQLRLLDVYGDELLKSQSNATGKFLRQIWIFLSYPVIGAGCSDGIQAVDFGDYELHVHQSCHPRPINQGVIRFQRRLHDGFQSHHLHHRYPH